MTSFVSERIRTLIQKELDPCVLPALNSSPPHLSRLATSNDAIQRGKRPRYRYPTLRYSLPSSLSIFSPSPPAILFRLTQIPAMSDPTTPFSPAFAIDPLLPPPRPPRIRPPSRSSSVGTDLNSTNSGVWPDVTLATLIDQDKIPRGTYYKDYIRDSFMDSTDTISPVRDSTTPMLGFKLPPALDGDHPKTSSDTYTRRSDGAQTPNNRSKVRTVCLVLSCAGAMIINVSVTLVSVLCASADFLCL